MGVIIIIAVFWLLGLLMAWSMCVVAARADRRMEEIRHTHTDTDISRPGGTGMGTPIPLSDIVRVSCGLCGTVRSHGRPIPGHVLTREESIWLQPFASWS